MYDHFLIFDRFYLENFGLIAAFLILLGTIVFFLKDKNVHYQVAWSSIVSWSYVLPVIFILFALPSPWPVAVLAILSIYALKTFFQMTGMYHRDYFVNLSYLLIALGAYLIYTDQKDFFMALPMVALSGFIGVAIIRNNYENMVQYIGLSIIGFSIYGWFYMHGAAILMNETGVYVLVYLYALSELSIALSSSLSLRFGKLPLRNRINSKIKLDGFIISTIVTIGFAWAWRRMLPTDLKSEWFMIGLICSLFSTLGDLTLSVIRKDLKIKDQGVFIIGRGDLLSRVNKVIFVFPAYYYFVKILSMNFQL